MKRLLKRQGYRVATAASGEAALGMTAFEPVALVSEMSLGVVAGRALLARAEIETERVLLGVVAERARVAPGRTGAFRVLGRTAVLEGVVSAIADAVPSRSFMSSLSPRRLGLLTLVVATSVILTVRFAPRFMNG